VKVDPQRARALLGLLESTLRRSGAPVPKARRAASAEPADRTAFERAVIANALEVVEGSPTLPSAGEVRIYLRPGRRYTRVFWEYPGSRSGSILHFVEQATGRVFTAKSAKKVGVPTGRVITVAPVAEAGEPVAPPAEDSTGAELEYVGPKVPRWVAQGVRVRVKSTPLLREYGVRTRGSIHGAADDRAWPKEVGTVRRREGNGVWDWRVEFERGRTAVLDEELLAAVVRVRGEQAVAPSPDASPSGALTLREQLRQAAPLTPQEVFAALGMPKAVRTKRERRSGIEVRKQGPKEVSVEWVEWGDGGQDARRRRFDEALERLAAQGYGLHLLSGEVGPAAIEAARQRGIVLVHRPKGAVGKATREPPEEAPAKPKAPVDLAQALETARAHGRAVVQLAQVYVDAPSGEGSRALEAFRTVLASALDALRELPVLQRRVFVDEVKRAYREAAELARSIQGEGWREGGEALLRRGTHAQVFTEDLDRAFKTLGVPRRYVLESPLPDLPEPATPAPASEQAPRGRSSLEVWERDRVVWFRSIDAGEDERRVELRRGETAWVSLGGRAGELRGFWASVNGISKAKRQLRMNEQWIDLPFVYTREEMAGESIPAPPGGEPPAGGAFAELLEGLRTRRIRTLRLASTDSTPHEMKVARVQSRPGVVVAEGKIKRSKAKLTIHTEVDARGRPAKYADLQRGSRHYRVEPKRITAPSLPAEAPSEAPTEPPAPPERRETEHQRERRERAERKAERLGRLADAQWEDARAETEHIPLGQPILAGHHSERRHRKALERQHRKEGQAIETLRAAEAARSAAKRAGHAISSDDPEAIEALEARLAELEAERALSKAINAAYRKGGWEAVEEVPGVTPKLLSKAKRTMEVAHWLKAPMDTKNLGANVRRVKKRLEELQAAAERTAAPPIEGDGFTITEHAEDNRIRFTFAERPSRDVTAKMKRAGFRWSRRHGAWQRQLNAAGRYAAREMARELFGWEPPSGSVEAREAAEPTDEERRRAEWQARAKAEHAELMERRERLPSGPPRGAPPPESPEECRARAGITAEDRERYPADVIEEAEVSGIRPERVLALREMSRREEEEMGQKLRAAARARSSPPKSDAALARVAEVLEPLTSGTREAGSRQLRFAGPTLASADRTPDAAALRAALAELARVAEHPTKAARNRLRQTVSGHLGVARRHANRLARRYGAGSEELRDAREVRDLLEQARARLAKGS